MKALMKAIREKCNMGCYTYLLIVLWQQGCELVDYDPRGQIIVCRRAINLLALPIDLADFFVKCPRPRLESDVLGWTLTVELGVVLPRGGTILIFLGCPESSC
jgi:hypothetical protein